MCAQAAQCQGKVMRYRGSEGQPGRKEWALEKRACWGQGVEGSTLSEGISLSQARAAAVGQSGPARPGTLSCGWWVDGEGFQGRHGKSRVDQEGTRGRRRKLGLLQ